MNTFVKLAGQPGNLEQVNGIFIFKINYLSKIFPSYVKKNDTEASCYNLFFHGKGFLSRSPANLFSHVE